MLGERAMVREYQLGRSRLLVPVGPDALESPGTEAFDRFDFPSKALESLIQQEGGLRSRAFPRVPR